MGSVVLPLLWPSRFGKTRVRLFLAWMGLTILLVLLIPNETAHFWWFLGFLWASVLGSLILDAQQSQRSAILPGIARRMRYDLLFVLAMISAAVGVIQWLVSGPIGPPMASVAWGLALGLRAQDKRVSLLTRSLFIVIYLFFIFSFVYKRDVLVWMATHWVLSIAIALPLLAYSAILLLSDEAVRDRPFLAPAPPRGVRPVHFANRNRSTRSCLGRPLPFRLNGTSTSVRGWIRAAHFESSFGYAGTAFSLINWIASGVFLLVLAAIVMLLDFYIGFRTSDVEWMGLAEHLRRSVLGGTQGLLVALLWGLTLFAASGLRHDFPYPMSRRRRWHVAFLVSLNQHASVILAGFAFAAIVALGTATAASTLFSGPLPGMVRGLFVVSLLAPVLQWQRAVGRRDWLQGDSIGRPFKVLLFLGLYVALAFVWRSIFATVDLSTEISAYGVFLALSQLMYYFELRQYFSRADLVSAPA